MKKLIFIIPLLFLFLNINAQFSVLHQQEMVLDTITDTGTVTFTCTKTFDKAAYLGIYVKTNVLTGTGAGTISYQTAARGSTSWYTFATDTIANATNTFVYYEGILYGQKFRVSATGTGTQSTQVYATLVVKKML